MGFFHLEDFHGTVECVLFARTFAELGEFMSSDRIVFVEGKVDLSRDAPSLHVDRLIPVEEAPRRLAQGVLLRLESVDEERLDKLRTLLQRHAGDLPVVLEFSPEPEIRARVKAGPGWNVAPSEALFHLLGEHMPDLEAAEFLAQAP